MEVASQRDQSKKRYQGNGVKKYERHNIININYHYSSEFDSDIQAEYA